MGRRPTNINLELDALARAVADVFAQDDPLTAAIVLGRAAALLDPDRGPTSRQRIYADRTAHRMALD